jgi:hypothetical protein
MLLTVFLVNIFQALTADLADLANFADKFLFVKLFFSLIFADLADFSDFAD